MLGGDWLIDAAMFRRLPSNRPSLSSFLQSGNGKIALLVLTVPAHGLGELPLLAFEHTGGGHSLWGHTSFLQKGWPLPKHLNRSTPVLTPIRVHGSAFYGTDLDKV